MNKTVVVGMSGGVNSSVAAYLLKKQGYNVIGLFMKNWDEKDDAGICTATKDYNDVVRVANELDIPYYSTSFEKEYMEQVFQPTLQGFLKGKYPSIDILCNEHVKFGLFKEFALQLGADFIATGHYAKIEELDGDIKLLQGADINEQTYFLSMMPKEKLNQVLFPLSDISRWGIRELAIKEKIATAAKTDSDGLCFIGEQEFNQFIRDHVKQEKGQLVDENEEIIGQHDGLAYYKMGSKYDFIINGEEKRLTVIGKKLDQQQIITSENFSHPSLYTDVAFIERINILQKGIFDNDIVECMVKTGYRKEEMQCKLEKIGAKIKINFESPIRALLPGQHIAFYHKNQCVGGAFVS